MVFFGHPPYKGREGFKTREIFGQADNVFWQCQPYIVTFLGIETALFVSSEGALYVMVTYYIYRYTATF